MQIFNSSTVCTENNTSYYDVNCFFSAHNNLSTIDLKLLFFFFFSRLFCFFCLFACEFC